MAIGHELPKIYLPATTLYLVKTLHLVSISYLTNEAVSSLVSDLKFLESLVIAKSRGLRSLRVVASSKLVNLTVFDCPQLTSLHIKAPTLHSFRYRGLLPWFSFDLELSLADAMFDFRKGPGYRFMNHDFDLILRGIKSAKNLTLCRWTLEKLISPLLTQDQFEFLWYHQFHTLKELWWFDYYLKDEEYSSDALIYLLKFCPSLEILSVTIDRQSYKVSSTGTFPAEISSDTTLKHLKVVKLDGFRSQEDEISLAEKLRATSNGNNSLRSLKLSELQEGSFTYKFVAEEVIHINELCPKHPHIGL
ncbi:hypothetical protein ACOSQ3_033159 [Xanthoceras sorbifolium]